MLTYHLPCVVPMKAWSTLNGPRFFFNSTRKLGFQGDERNQVASIFSISYVGVWSRHYRDFLKTWNVIKDNVLKSFCSYGWARNSHAYPFIPVIGQDWPPEVRDDREFCVTNLELEKFCMGRPWDTCVAVDRNLSNNFLVLKNCAWLWELSWYLLTPLVKGGFWVG